MRDLQFIIVPGIIVGIVGGILLFFLAYNYYPQKNVNINLNGRCYEFLDGAYQRYQDLVSFRESELLKMQIEAIGESYILVPVTFSGSSVDVDRIIDDFDINVTDIQTLGDENTRVDKMIVKGVVSTEILEQILNNISENNTNTTLDSMPKIGILPNSGISASESAKISNNIDQFMTKGIKEIMLNKNGVKETECRSTIIYND
ncbi:hypothetical protein [Candidatus Nitrosocosmicus arcticus]|uniref:Uncharacterized protein n=1 Tax=Candidatus Nitrosocosmicus arcticus TaxID=2035267 RepID=A0A557SWW7_9ARCH|nr:hypothetical protein [Candidatus Nitrosocosmicus arcticus]TVP41095.1 hypothetical protein NARC_40055 [Candidatus Nitrosocosmicus arcticus]